MKIQLDKLMTEQQNPDTMSIDRMNSFEIVKAINNEDKKIALAVEKELASKLPWVEIRGLMLYYVLMRDAMTGRDEMDFEDAVVKVSKRQRMIKVTPEILKVVREVLDENG